MTVKILAVTRIPSDRIAGAAAAGAVAALVALTLLLALAPAARAATATFGANLARPADSPFTCTNNPSNLFQVPTTCSGQSINLATGESTFPPVGEGVVTAVRIRVGPVTGPMQIVVEQALRKDNPIEPGKPTYACCSVTAMSPVFTPAANAITTVPVNLRVRQDITPDQNGIYVDQHLALSVLSPNVPIPAALDGNSSYGLWFPAWQAVGEQRAGAAGNVGLMVLINADWDPAGAPGATPAPGAVRALSIPNRNALVRNERARVALFCGLSEACVGRLLLQNRQTSGAARAFLAGSGALARPGKGKRKVVTYGSVKFRIAAGKRKAVRVKLNRRGKRLLNRRSRPKVWANVRMGGYSVPPSRLTLKPAGKRKKK